MSDTDLTTLDLASELERLAQGVVRDVGSHSSLSCVGQLTAIRTLSQVLLEALVNNIVVSPETQRIEPQPRFPIGFRPNDTQGRQS